MNHELLAALGDGTLAVTGEFVHAHGGNVAVHSITVEDGRVVAINGADGVNGVLTLTFAVAATVAA